MLCFTAIGSCLFLLFPSPTHLSTGGSGEEVAPEGSDPLAYYGETNAALAKLVREQDPGAALDALTAFIGTGKEERQICHRLAHAVGAAAFTKYEDFQTAISFSRPMCASGYMHGVTEAYIRKLGNVLPEDRPRVLYETCSGYAPNTYVRASCLHGVGHGIMLFMNNDLPQALAYCQSFEGLDDSRNCREGVFMENFDVDLESHEAPYVKSDAPFYACDLQMDPLAKRDCYLWSSLQYFKYHHFDYTGGLTWCKQAGSFEPTCAQGVGIGAGINVPDMRDLEAICATASSKAARDACISGAVQYLAKDSYKTFETAYASCSSFSSEFIEVCRQVVRSEASFFDE